MTLLPIKQCRWEYISTYLDLSRREVATYSTYTPDKRFKGTDTFTYTATDGQVESAPATHGTCLAQAAETATMARAGIRGKESVYVSSERVGVRPIGAGIKGASVMAAREVLSLASR
jgi:Bacterial Ig domain